MKSIKSRLGTLVLVATTLFLIGWFPSSIGSETNSKSNAIVIIKFKAQPEKGAQTVSELTKLLEQVRKEPNFVSIKMHVDPNDDTNVLLYEEWEDASYYNNEHMNTPHLKAFMEASSNFLTGPPDITFWNVESVFEK